MISIFHFYFIVSVLWTNSYHIIVFSSPTKSHILVINSSFPHPLNFYRHGSNKFLCWSIATSDAWRKLLLVSESSSLTIILFKNWRLFYTEDCSSLYLEHSYIYFQLWLEISFWNGLYHMKQLDWCLTFLCFSCSQSSGLLGSAGSMDLWTLGSFPIL